MENNVRIKEDELKALRLKIRKVVEVDLEKLSPECENNNVFPKEMWEIGRKNDMFRLSLPVEYGGMGLCFEQYFTLLEEIARGNGGMRMFWHVANGLSWEILCERGAEDMKNNYLPKMATGDYFVAFALTEKDCGSGADIRTKAEKKGDKWILNGSKTLISFTDVCDAYYIIACTDESKRKTKGGFTAFFVPADSKGLRVENMPHMMGCRGAGHGDVIMEDVELPDCCRLGAEGDGLKVFLHALAISRASIGVCLLGMSQRFLEIAVKRSKDRVTFGKSLAQRQAIQQQLADMATQVMALRLMARECAVQIDNDVEDLEMITSMLKLHGIDTVKLVSDGALEIMGGIGYFEDNPYGPLERLYRDARGMWLEEGPRTVQRLTLVRDVIAKGGELRHDNYV
jgi:alkylation response protein AidB-like acyl-CoA dehydrogenase